MLSCGWSKELTDGWRKAGLEIADDPTKSVPLPNPGEGRLADHPSRVVDTA
jgi:hypothetical protein